MYILDSGVGHRDVYVYQIEFKFNSVHFTVSFTLVLRVQCRKTKLVAFITLPSDLQLNLLVSHL